jgi:hypothetical protein
MRRIWYAYTPRDKYYCLLVCQTGIRDRDSRAETERVFLDPMRQAVDKWLEQVDHGESQASNTIVSDRSCPQTTTMSLCHSYHWMLR